MNSNGEEVLVTVSGFRATGVILIPVDPGCLEVGPCFRYLMLALENRFTVIPFFLM